MIEQADINRLWAIAGDVAEPCCWLGGDDADPAEDYCRACCEKAVAAGLGEFVEGDGGSISESDSCRHCTTCGQLLSYTLTDHGAAVELDHFEMYPPNSLTPEVAYHLAQLAEAARDNPEVEQVIKKALAA